MAGPDRVRTPHAKCGRRPRGAEGGRRMRSRRLKGSGPSTGLPVAVVRQARLAVAVARIEIERDGQVVRYKDRVDLKAGDSLTLYSSGGLGMAHRSEEHTSE